MMTTEHEGTTPAQEHDDSHALRQERSRLLVRITRALETPMSILGLVWLVLLVIDLTKGLPPLLSQLNYVIWGLFAAQFAVEFVVAPHKLLYLRHHWLTAVALILPAARLLRAFRAVRALGSLRGIRVVRIVSRINRGMGALGRVLGRRGFGYVGSLSLLVTVGGAAGMYALEHSQPGSSLTDFGSALWWTAMTLTTMGSDYFPKSAEGRLLCFLLALYGFAVFGYVTATIASFFVARDADTDDGDLAGARQIDRLAREVSSLHQKLDALTELLSERKVSGE
jgi:voltage-gated potassium channel